MEAIVSSVVGKLAEYIVDPALRQFGYLIHYQSNLDNLDKKIEELIARRDDVKSRTDAATRNLQTIISEVELWFTRVDQTIQDKETCFKQDKIAKATCCAGWFPNLKVRHSLNRKAKKMTGDVDSLLEEKFDAVARPVSPPELGVQHPQHSEDSNALVTNPSTPVSFESRKSTIGDVLEALKGKFNPIVICGMGGVGKTTMVGEVISKAKSMGLFNEYTKAVVNVKPDVSKIQSDIAEFLGLKFEELKGLEARADKLRKRLSGTTSVLLVLDNVWEMLDLQEIGIPSNVESCKILVTSRNQDIFNEMGEGRKIFPIGVLPENDAWSLFKKVAGNDIESDPELRSIAEQVLKECGGLPVAISTLGSALGRKKTAFWKDALGRLLREPFRGDIQGMKKNVYQPIRLSYDYLERNEAKSLFLLCGIFEESTDIPVDDLVTHGFGLGVFHGIDSVERARDRVEALIDTLKSYYLLVDSDKEECVRMHDVVRAVGLEIASDESTDGTFLIRHGVALENFSQQHKCTSLTTANKRRSHELLLVSLNKRYSEVMRLDAVNGTEELKVLDVSIGPWWCFRSLESLPLPMRSIQTLCLRGLVLGSEAISMIGEMRTLTTLRLARSSIEHVPEEFKNLCNLKLLDLAACERLENISPGVISSLSKLEEFYLLKSCRKWSHDKLAGLCSELLQLPSLTRLESPLGVVEGSMHLLANKLKRFRLYALGLGGRLTKLHFPKGKPRERDNMMMLAHLGPDYSRLGLSELVKKSHCLWFSSGNLGRPFIEIDAECGANLKDLHVVNCHALEYLVDLTRTTETTPVVFPLLTLLYIGHAWKLKEIIHGVPPVGSLKSLRRITINNAHELMHVWKTGGDRFDRLECLELESCKSLQVIVAGHGEEEASDDDQLHFPNLTHLWVKRLPNLVGITSRKVCKLNFSKLLELQLRDLPKFTGQWLNCLAPSSNSGDVVGQHLFDFKVDFPVLQSLEIIKMHNFEEICHHQLSPHSFYELTLLRVDNCDKISHLVPMYMQNRLQKLERINVSECSSLQEIFEMRISMVNNEDVGLRDTHSNVYQADQGILQINSQSMIFKGFQHLSELSVRECKALRKVCSSSIARSLVNLKFLFINNCCNMEEIVEAEEGEEEEGDNMFPCLANLTLADVPNLVSFSRHKYALDWPSMEKITIKECPAMKKFCLGSLTTSAELEIDISGDVDENVRRELDMSKRIA